MNINEIKVVSDKAMQVGECPLWHDKEQALYWVDIDGRAVHRLHPDSGQHTQWDMPTEPSALAINAGGGLIVALRSGFAHLDTNTGSLAQIAPAPFDMATTRKSSSRGRLWQWFIPLALNFKEASGKTSLDINAVISALQHALVGSPDPAFACALRGRETGILLCLAKTEDLEDTLSGLHARIGSALAGSGVGDRWTLGVGTGSNSFGEAALGGLDDASRVAHSASSMNHSSASYHRASDLGFRWLMQQLLDVQETRTYLHDQLAPFLEEPEYLDFIEIYLQTNGSITEMSRALHLSRPSVYARLRRIEKVLGHELTDADTMTSLHLAVTLYRLGVREQEH